MLQAVPVKLGQGCSSISTNQKPRQHAGRPTSTPLADGRLGLLNIATNEREGAIDSGFSAAQLSPMELRFNSAEAACVLNGVEGEGQGLDSRSGVAGGKASRYQTGNTDGIPQIGLYCISTII